MGIPPNTPFATRLSGSARELCLRIRSIVQGAKKRPPVLLAVPVLLLCVLSGSLVAFVAPEKEEKPLAPPPVVHIVDVAPALPEPVRPDPEPVQPNPVPPSEALAALELSSGTFYIAQDPHPTGQTSPYATYIRTAAYWLTSGGTAQIDTGLYFDQSNLYTLRTLHVLGLDCLEVARYRDEHSLDKPIELRLYNLDREDGVPFCTLVVWGDELTYEDVNGDGILDIVGHQYGDWYTRTSGGRILRVLNSWTELPGTGWLVDELTVNGLTFQAVAEDTDILYWLDGDTRTVLGHYSTGALGSADSSFDYLDDGQYDEYITRLTEKPYILGHRVITVAYTLGGRYMIDFYAIDTPEPTFLLSTEEESTRYLDLDGDGVEELILDKGNLFFPQSDTASFHFIFTRGPEGQPLCADLAQVWPEYRPGPDRFDEDGNFVRHSGDNDSHELLFTGPEIMEMITAAGAWSEKMPTWKDITDLAGPRGPRNP